MWASTQGRCLRFVVSGDFHTDFKSEQVLLQFIIE